MLTPPFNREARRRFSKNTSKYHTMRPADDLSRTDGDSSGKVWGTLDSDYNEGEVSLLKGLLTARKDGQFGQVAELVDANTCGKYAEQGEQH